MKLSVMDVPVDYAGAGLPDCPPAKLTAYLWELSSEMPTHTARPAVIICPGGAYAFTSDREADPVALSFMQKGFQCFVLRYNVQKAPFPAALLELAASVAMVKKNAKEWLIDPSQVFVMGFSAGGHLACSLGVFWNRDFVTGPLKLNAEECRPTGMLLGYPVISAGEYAHRDTFRYLLGDTYDKNLELVSLENQVSDATVPAFLWHTDTDPAVPVENTLLLALAMKKHHIPLEVHIFPYGGHGLSIATDVTDSPVEGVEKWPEWAARWMVSRKGQKPVL